MASQENAEGGFFKKRAGRIEEIESHRRHFQEIGEIGLGALSDLEKALLGRAGEGEEGGGGGGLAPRDARRAAERVASARQVLGVALEGLALAGEARREESRRLERVARELSGAPPKKEKEGGKERRP